MSLSNDGWRTHLLLVGWAAVLVAAAATAWLYLQEPTDRYFFTEGFRIDKRTGEMRQYDRQNPVGKVVMEAVGGAPSTPTLGQTWVPFPTPTPLRRGNVVDDAGILNER